MLVGVLVVLSVPLLGRPARLPLALGSQVLVISVIPDGPPVVLAAIHG